MAGSTGNPAVDVADVINKLAPTIFGKTDATSEQISNLFDPTALGQSNAIFDILKQRGSSTAAADSVVQDILYRAQLAFAPVLGEEKSAGMYNSTVKTQLAHEAVARATAASADAVFKMQQQSLDAAAQITNAQIQASKTTNKTGGTKTAGQGKNLAVGIGASLAAGEAYKKAKGMFSAKSTAAVDPEMADAVKDYQLSTGAKAGEGDIAAGGGFDESSILTGLDTSSTVAEGTAPLTDSGVLLASAADVGASTTDAVAGIGVDAGASTAADNALDTAASAAEGTASDPSFWESFAGDLGFADGGSVNERKKPGPALLYTPRVATPNPNQPSAARRRLEGAVNPVVDAVTAAITDWKANFRGEKDSVAKEEPGYADGGSIEDRVAYTEGSNQLRAGQTAAHNIVQGGADAIPVVSRTSPRAVSRNLNTMDGEDLSKILTQQAEQFNKIASSPTAAAPDAAAAPATASPSVGTAPTGIGAIAGIAAALASINAPIGLITSVLAHVANANAEVDTSLGISVANDPDAGVAGGPDDPGVAGVDASTGANAGETDSSGPAGSADAGSDSGSSDGSSGDGGGDGFFGGGLVVGKDAEDFSGVDKQKINVTPDEYVLPEDIVKLLGKDNLDELLRKFHKPVRASR